jgi:hypothetical protein
LHKPFAGGEFCEFFLVLLTLGHKVCSNVSLAQVWANYGIVPQLYTKSDIDIFFHFEGSNGAVKHFCTKQQQNAIWSGLTTLSKSYFLFPAACRGTIFTFNSLFYSNLITFFAALIKYGPENFVFFKASRIFVVR